MERTYREQHPSQGHKSSRQAANPGRQHIVGGRVHSQRHCNGVELEAMGLWHSSIIVHRAHKGRGISPTVQLIPNPNNAVIFWLITQEFGMYYMRVALPKLEVDALKFTPAH